MNKSELSISKPESRLYSRYVIQLKVIKYLGFIVSFLLAIALWQILEKNFFQDTNLLLISCLLFLFLAIGSLELIFKTIYSIVDLLSKIEFNTRSPQ